MGRDSSGSEVREPTGIVLVALSGVLLTLLVAALLFMQVTLQTRTRSGALLQWSRAGILSRSGLEYASARLAHPGPTPALTPAGAGDDWVFRDPDPTRPLAATENPSYNIGELWDDVLPGRAGAFEGVDTFSPAHDRSRDGRHTAFSGRLRGAFHAYGDFFRLRISGGGLHVNDPDDPCGEDADGDGVQDPVGAFADNGEPDLNGNGIFDRGRLEFMINNLALALRAEGRGPSLNGREGTDLIAARVLLPGARFVNRDQMRAALGDARYREVGAFLSLHAWQDDKVAQPVRLLSRPGRRYRDASYGVENEIVGFGDVVYAWKDLNPGAITMARRAPVDLQGAPIEVLAACFAGLSGFYISDEVHPPQHTIWNGNFYLQDPGGGGSHYALVDSLQYEFDKTPSAYMNRLQNKWPTDNGRIGIVRRSVPITLAQAVAVARAIRARPAPFRTWQEFGAWIDALPLDEDLPRGTPFTPAVDVTREPVAAPNGLLDYGEDMNNNAVLNGGILNRYQRDALKAMANPNTDLNDLNPDAILYKDVDKTDLHIWTTELSMGPTGVFEVESLGLVQHMPGVGDAPSAASAEAAVTLRAYRIHRDTTQEDFLREPLALPSAQFLDGNVRSLYGAGTPPDDPPTLSANNGAVAIKTDGTRSLLTYPEPVLPHQGDASTAIRAGGFRADGQVGLATVGSLAGANAPGFRMDFYETGVDASTPLPGWNGMMVNDKEVDRTVYTPLLPPGGNPGAVHPDGFYGENHTSARYEVPDDPAWDIEGGTGVVTSAGSGGGFVALWWKPHWFPERTQKVRSPFSLPNRFMIVDDLGATRYPLNVFGAFFLPAPYPCPPYPNPPFPNTRTDRNFIAQYTVVGDAEPQIDSRCIGWGGGHANSVSGGGGGGGYGYYDVSKCLNHQGHGDAGVDYLRHHAWTLLGFGWRSAISGGVESVRAGLALYVNGAGGWAPAGIRNGSVAQASNDWEALNGRNNLNRLANYDRNKNLNDNSHALLCFGATASLFQEPAHATGFVKAGYLMNGTPDGTLDAIRVWPCWDESGVYSHPNEATPTDVVQLWQDGRYYKEGDAEFVSAPVDAATLRLAPGTPVRILSVDWTAYVPPNNGDPAAPLALVRRVGVGAGSVDMSYRMAVGGWSPLEAGPGPARLVAPAFPFRYRIHFNSKVPDPVSQPLLVSPYLDDVTIRYQAGAGAELLAWEQR